MLRTAPEIKKMVEDRFAGSHVELRDLTGTADHWQVTVVAKEFEGQSMINQHRMVKAIFENDIATGAVHAFSLKTYTPDEWAKKKS